MNKTELTPVVDLELFEEIQLAAQVVSEDSSPVERTELTYDEILSDCLGADVFLASEIHQPIGAYKIRGAYNFVSQMSSEQRQRGVVTASAGNHAQGIALSCNSVGVSNHIFMPETTPDIKVDRVAELGGSSTEITLSGQTFDECEAAALTYCEEGSAVFAHPFNDKKVIAGQGTWGLEITEALYGIDLVFCPVGGMGLLAGISTAIKYQSPETEIVGVEPSGAQSLTAALSQGKPSAISGSVDTFIEGAAVKKVGQIPFRLAQNLVSKVVDVSNRQARVATSQLWERENPIRAELAGALSIAGLYKCASQARGKSIVCLVSGGNLSTERYEREVKLEV